MHNIIVDDKKYYKILYCPCRAQFLRLSSTRGVTPGWNISGLQPVYSHDALKVTAELLENTQRPAGLQPVYFHDALKGLHNIAQWQRLG
ncbi:MAG: hypothetical protein LBN74_05150 [Prevotella sp.]|nr:hypothetical protein [Prevotella sp.]